MATPKEIQPRMNTNEHEWPPESGKRIMLSRSRK
jgi:hypothetical protein